MTKYYSSFFIRHGKLLLPYKDHSEMPLKVLADLASSKLNPPIDTNFAEEQIPRLIHDISLRKIEKIYNSPSQRCQDTARFLSKLIFENYGKEINPVTIPELREVRFDLLEIYPKGDTVGFNIGSVNDLVFKAMAGADQHCESASSAYKRVGEFFKLAATEESVLFVTHDFIMRVIEIYIKNNGAPRHQVTYEELKGTQRNLYLHGFATDSSLDTFLPF